MTQIQLYINDELTYTKPILYSETEEWQNKLKRLYGLFEGSAKVKWDFFLVVRSKRLEGEKSRFLEADRANFLKLKTVLNSEEKAIFAGEDQSK